MWKKVLVVGATAAAIVGTGTAALAVTGGTSPTPSPSTSTAAGAHAKHAKHGGALTHALHATWVTKDATGYVTHDAIRGTVTAVSPSAITVRALDGVSETYAVGTTTVEHLKADGKTKGTAGQIAKVEKGDKVGVLGTGASTLSATHVVDVTR